MLRKPFIKRTGRQLLRYVVAHGLDAATLFHLARRQERLSATKFAATLGVTRTRFARMSAPSDCSKDYASCRGNRQLTSIARRFGLTGQDEIAKFRLLITSDTATPRVSQCELADAFLKDSDNQPRSAFVWRFLAMLKERHGLPRRASLADAIWEQRFPTGATLPPNVNVRDFKRQLFSLTNANVGRIRLPDIWADAIAAFAFPGKRELKLRLALARYLKFQPSLKHSTLLTRNPLRTASGTRRADSKRKTGEKKSS
jgi:hypothetical protein